MRIAINYNFAIIFVYKLQFWYILLIKVAVSDVCGDFTYEDVYLRSWDLAKGILGILGQVRDQAHHHNEKRATTRKSSSGWLWPTCGLLVSTWGDPRPCHMGLLAEWPGACFSSLFRDSFSFWFPMVSHHYNFQFSYHSHYHILFVSMWQCLYAPPHHYLIIIIIIFLSSSLSPYLHQAAVPLCPSW